MDFVTNILQGIEKNQKQTELYKAQKLESGILSILNTLETPLNERNDDDKLSTEIYICMGHSSNTSFSNDIIANQNTTFIIADTCGYLYNVKLTLIAIVCSALFIKYKFSKDIISIINFISKKHDKGTVKFAKQIKPKENTLLLDSPDSKNADNILVFQSGVIKITADTRLKPTTILTPYSEYDKRIGITKSHLSNIYPKETIFPPQELIEYAFNTAVDINQVSGYKDFNSFKNILEQAIKERQFGDLSHIDMYLSHISSRQKYIIEVNCRILPDNIYVTPDNQPYTQYTNILQHMRDDAEQIQLARKNSQSINQSNIQNLQDCTWQFNRKKNGWECFKIINGIKQIFAVSSNPNMYTIYEVTQKNDQNYITKQINGTNYSINIDQLVDFNILKQDAEISGQVTSEQAINKGSPKQKQDSSESLPPPKKSDARDDNNNWVQYHSNKYNVPYWFNTETGESSWTNPATIGGYSFNTKGTIVKKSKKKYHQIQKKQKTNKKRIKSKNRIKNKSKNRIKNKSK